MKNLEKYKGIIPSFYACYEDDGSVSPARAGKLARYFFSKGPGIRGLYVGGSAGECLFQSVSERKAILESVMETCPEGAVIIAHVAANSTGDSVELAKHASSCGVDAIAAIPTIYYRLPEYSVADYWNAISDAAPDTDFVIYNIPQLTGVELTESLFSEMLRNNRLIGVKDSSGAMDSIRMIRKLAGENFIIFNGMDERFTDGRLAGADGGIGATYGCMPELFIILDDLIKRDEIEKARELQAVINEIISKIYGCRGHLYSGIKTILKSRGIDTGEVRLPLTPVGGPDLHTINACISKIDETADKFS